MAEKLPTYVIPYDPEKKSYLPGEIRARLNARGQKPDPFLIDHDTAELTIDHPEFFEVIKKLKDSGQPLPPYETAFRVKLKKELLREPRFIEQFKNPINATLKARAQAIGGGVPGEFKYRQISIQVEVFELVVRAKVQAQREYGGVKLNENEFVADTHDALEFEIFARCKERPTDVVVGLEEIDVVLEGTDTNRYKRKIEKIPETRKWSLTIYALKPLLYEGTEDGQKITLKVKGRVKLSEGTSFQLVALNKDLQARFVFLKLWVVPGVRQGQSEAGAICCVAPDSSQLLAGVPLALWVKTVNDFGMPGYGVRLEPATSDKERRTFDDLKTDQLGTVKWKLAYRNLNWETLDFAQFEVRCGILPSADAFADDWRSDGKDSKPRPVTCTSFNIDVRQNVHAMLVDLNAAAPNLEPGFDNPFFKSGKWDMEADSLILKDWVRGPAWNISLKLDTSDPFVCYQMRERIFKWLSERRKGFAGQVRGSSNPTLKVDKIDPDLMARMNGIEIGTYEIVPIHVFAGFHLSGTKPDEEPKFIDPWWRQQWSDVLTWKEEVARLTYCVFTTAGLALLVAKMATFAAAGWAGEIGKAVGTAGLGKMSSAISAVSWWLASTPSRSFAAKLIGATNIASIGHYKFLIGADTSRYLTGDEYRDMPGDWLKDAAQRWKTSPHKLPAVAPIDIW